MMRMTIAPPIIPPRAGFESPLLEVVLGFVLGMAASGLEVTFGIAPEAPVDSIPVGACGVIAVTIVDVNVWATPFLVVVVVSSNVTVMISVE
jgi:hypothetical protein